MSSLKTSRHFGLVKWYVPKKGYGFIIEWDETTNEIKDVFFHITQYRPDIIPQTGQMTEYYLESAQKGLRATDCIILKDLELMQTPYMQFLHEYMTTKLTSENSLSME